MEQVFVPLPIDTVEEEVEKPSKTYRLDLDNGRIVGTVDGIEAVQQAIRKALITPRFKCLIYDNQYGSEIKDAIIANDASEEYTKTVIGQFIKDALSVDTRITSVSEAEVEFVDDSAHIAFSVDTIYGEISVEEVI